MSLYSVIYNIIGKCSFKQYIPSKASKYGLKLWAINDVETSFLLDLDIYLGKLNEKSNKNKEIGKNVVLKLSNSFNHTGRVITADNFFSSVSLAQELRLRGLKFVGTLRANKTEIPIEFRPCKDRPIDSSIFGFNDYLTLLSFVPKEK